MGRIVAVADVFDAMTSHRPYRPALSVEKVMAHLEENSGVLFGPDCVQALKNIIERSD
jgi:two-component system response regulator RpfG